MGPSLHRLEHQNQTVADTGSEYPAARSRSSCMGTTGCENSGEIEKTVHYGTNHELLFMCLGSARETFEGGLECTRSGLHYKFGGGSGQRNGFLRGFNQRTNVQVLVKP